MKTLKQSMDDQREVYKRKDQRKKEAFDLIAKELDDASVRYTRIDSLLIIKTAGRPGIKIQWDMDQSCYYATVGIERSEHQLGNLIALIADTMVRWAR